MKNFFLPTRQRVIVAIILFVYVILSVTVLSSYNGDGRHPYEQTHFTTVDKVAFIIAVPAMVVAVPSLYVGELVNRSLLAIDLPSFISTGVALVVLVLFCYILAVPILQFRKWLVHKLKN